MGTPLGPKYIPYTYIDPLGLRQSYKTLGVKSILWSAECGPCPEWSPFFWVAVKELKLSYYNGYI